MRDRRDDQYAVILEADKSTVKQVVDAGREEQPVLAVQTLTIAAIAPRFAVTRAEMNGIVNASDAAVFLELHDALFEKPLATTGSDERFSLCGRDAHVLIHLGFYVVLPNLDIGIGRSQAVVDVLRALLEDYSLVADERNERVLRVPLANTSGTRIECRYR
jgi:hypothetical protein